MRKIRKPDLPDPTKIADPITSEYAKSLNIELDGLRREINKNVGQLVVSSFTGEDTLGANDELVLADGTFTLTLPPAVSAAGRGFHIKNIGTGTITIDGNSSETIDGEATISLSSQYDFITITSDGTEWHIVSDMAMGRDRTWTGEATFTDDVIFADDVIFTDNGGLPFGEIYAADAADTIALAFTGVSDDDKAQITSFSANGASNNCTPDHTSSHITITKAGIYKCSVSIHIVSTGGGGADNYGYSVYKNDGGTEFTNMHGQRDLAGGGGDEGSVSLTGLIDLAVSDTIEVWIWNNTNADDVIVDDINLNLIQIGGT